MYQKLNKTRAFVSLLNYICLFECCQIYENVSGKKHHGPNYGSQEKKEIYAIYGSFVMFLLVPIFFYFELTILCFLGNSVALAIA